MKNKKSRKFHSAVYRAGTANRNDIPVNEKDIFDYMELIVESSKKSGLDKCLCDQKLKTGFDFITAKLGISPIQTVLFSHFMERSARNQIPISEIAESIKCSTIRIIKYMNECEELEKKRLIRCSRDKDTIFYRVPSDVRESLRKNNEFRPESIENLDINKFFAALDKLLNERQNNELTFETLAFELTALIGLNMHLEFCKKLMSFNLSKNDLILLIYFCFLFGNNNDDNIGAHDFEFLFDDRSEFHHTSRLLSTGDHILIVNKIMEFNNDQGYYDSESWKLSDKAKNELMSELIINKKRNVKKGIIKFDTISRKKMFYNERETKEINKLSSFLQEENYQNILKRLDGKGMRKGFACLFSGGPGTGKTETVFQIAHETKRNIMKVDISQLKSCWYGESEKKVKAVFDDYRDAVDGSEITPILLFNEADAVIGKRNVFLNGRGAVDQTENTIQNIILEELEKLSGILIATTNLTQNMDSAFERRFLYKITFDKPSLESRKGIWNALLPDITENMAVELSSKYDLSGGQIENIARKTEVDSIINGDNLSLETLKQYCKEEIQNSFNDKLKTIGF